MQLKEITFNIDVILFSRLKKINYLKNKEWSLSEMGEFWDNLDEYDDINSQIIHIRKDLIIQKNYLTT